jgi:hypothetical protein
MSCPSKCEVRRRRMQAEIAVEIDQPLVRADRDIRPETGKARLAIGLDEIEPVHRPAQNDRDETIVAGHRRKGHGREDGRCRQTAGGRSKKAAAGERKGLVVCHGDAPRTMPEGSKAASRILHESEWASAGQRSLSGG